MLLMDILKGGDERFLNYFVFVVNHVGIFIYGPWDDVESNLWVNKLKNKII